MSNNACRLLFRVGETHWIIQGQGFSFCLSLTHTHTQKWHCGSDVCQSLIWMQEPSVIAWLTLAVAAAAAWVAQKVDLCFFSVHAGVLHMARVSKTTGSWLLLALAPPETSLRYIMCHDSPDWCQRIKEHKITLPQWVVSLFYSRLFWYARLRQLLLSGFPEDIRGVYCGWRGKSTY